MSVKTLIPNAKTRQTIAEGRARKGVTVHTSIAEWRKSIKAVSARGRKPAELELTMKSEAELSGKV